MRQTWSTFDFENYCWWIIIDQLKKKIKSVSLLSRHKNPCLDEFFVEKNSYDITASLPELSHSDSFQPQKLKTQLRDRYLGTGFDEPREDSVNSRLSVLFPRVVITFLSV